MCNEIPNVRALIILGDGKTGGNVAKLRRPGFSEGGFGPPLIQVGFNVSYINELVLGTVLCVRTERNKTSGVTHTLMNAFVSNYNPAVAATELCIKYLNCERSNKRE